MLANLPTELLAAVCNSLSHQSDAINLALVNRRIHKIAVAMIWRNASFRNEGHLSKLIQDCRRRWDKSPGLIRQLTIQNVGHDEAETLTDSLQSDWSSYFEDVGRRKIPPWTESLQLELAGVESLILHLDTHETCRSFQLTRQITTDKLALTSLTLHNYSRWSLFLLTELMVASPKLKTLRLLTQARTLEADDTFLPDYTLDIIAQNAPNIQHLELAWLNNPSPSFFNAVAQLHQLKRLRLKYLFGQPGMSEETWANILTCCPHLTVLEVQGDGVLNTAFWNAVKYYGSLCHVKLNEQWIRIA
ncbi:hypothetical protein BZG36_02610 [Bifiguratus adelaidae]|uniref:F-box domain-containing protein n=1 Tax=Bifiguratus adelaidae TaxID=1938954 RepID=A0A261Y2K6_9FUNG|nr:hypothetical protein BZG36_02610 [Bifiguratus adelaidae]